MTRANKSCATMASNDGPRPRATRARGRTLALASVRLATIALLLFVLETTRAQEPNPLRREDVIDGRDFEYNEISFLHRFTYRPRTDLQWAWIRDPSGFRVTAGSVRSDELYLDLLLRKRWALDERFFFEFRQEVAEDFDGNFARTIAGAGLNLGLGWSAAVLAELDGTKENIDTHLELTWNGGTGRRLRIAAVAPDTSFNEKTKANEEYSRNPYTIFLEGLWTTEAGVSGQGWVNWNTTTRLDRPGEGYDFTYRALQGGVRALVPWRQWKFTAEGRFERGRNERIPIDFANATDVQQRQISRRHAEARLELNREISEHWDGWVGYRYFHWLERERRPQDLTNDRRITRRESMLYAGVTWRIRDHIVFWPGLYLDFVDNRETYDFNPARNDPEDGLVAKLALPIEILFKKGARLTINPTIRLDEFKFGGGNLQLQVPF